MEFASKIVSPCELRFVIPAMFQTLRHFLYVPVITPVRDNGSTHVDVIDPTTH